MGDCGVCLTAPEGDCTSEFFCAETRKARKPYRCSECNKEIEVGESHEYASGKVDGEFWSERTCLVCAEIANAFYCDGRMYGGELWEQMYETAFEHMTTGCLERLQTVAAKTELMRRWNDWKFEQA